MAQAPTQEQVDKLKAETQAAIDKKIISQQKLGKDFVPTGAGVIPEKIWKNLPGKQNG